MLNRNSKKMYLARKIVLLVMIVSFTLTVFSACASTAVEYFSAEVPASEVATTAEVGIETDSAYTLADVVTGDSTSSVVKLSDESSVTYPTTYWTTEGNYDASWYDSSKSSFEISSGAQLAYLAVLVNGGTDTFSDDTITLTEDIDLSDHEWTAIGSESYPFKGTFDGGGYEISGLYINIDSESYVYAGLFGYVSGGTIENVGVVDSSITVNSEKLSFAGGVVGTNANGTVENCYNTGNISLTVTGGNAFAGGVVGNNKGTVLNCYNTGDVSGTASGNPLVGGVAGNNDGGTVTNCYNTGDITGECTGSVDAYFGGVVGYNSGGTVANCYNTGDVSGSSSSGTTNAGSVVGYNYDGTVKYNYYLTGTADLVIGGSSGSITEGPNASFETDGTFGTTTYDWADETDVTITVGESSCTTLLSALNSYVDTYEGELSLSSWYFANGNGVGDAFASFSEMGYWTDEGNYDTSWYTASADPAEYTISSAAELAGLAVLVNGGTDTFSGDTITLTADIDLSDHEWTAIGTSSTYSFKGTFDGDGHTISGLYINQSSSTYQGLFGYVYGTTTIAATVKNVDVSGAVTGAGYTGGVVGYNLGGTVSNCSFSGSVTGGNPTGGVVGYNEGGTVSNCSFSGSVTGTSNAVGGVVGGNQGTVLNCYNTGSVSGSNSQYVGGVVGYNYSAGTVANCYNTGSVTGSSSVGGVVGYNGKEVTNCYNTGSVTGSSSVGGVVGSNGGTVSNCYAFSGITVNGASVASGTLIGSGSGTSANNATFGVDGLMDSAGEDESYTTFAVDDSLVDVLNSYVDTYNADDENTLTLSSWYFANGNEAGDAFASFSEMGYWMTVGNYDASWYTASDDSAEYTIDSAAQLAGLAFLVNGNINTFSGDTITLTGDIDLSAHEWTAIGTDSTYSFQGTFDGAGFEISGLYINIVSESSSYVYAGLFGYVSGGTVKDVGVVDGSITATSTSSDAYVGGVAGYNKGGTVSNCYFQGDVSCPASGAYKDVYVGGVAGYNNGGTIYNCYNAGDVSGVASGTANVGGVVGCNKNGTVSNCYFQGDVSGTAYQYAYVGGVAGFNASGAIYNCYNIGDVSCVDSDAVYVGGVVGYSSGTIYNCYNTGNVSVTAYDTVFAGGVVGFNTGGTAYNCYNTGDVSGVSTSNYVRIGGVVGSNARTSKIYNCYNTGDVSGTASSTDETAYAGGVVGYNDSDTVANCYAFSGVTVKGTSGASGTLIGSGSDTGCDTFGDDGNLTTDSTTTLVSALNDYVEAGTSGLVLQLWESGEYTGITTGTAVAMLSGKYVSVASFDDGFGNTVEIYADGSAEYTVDGVVYDIDNLPDEADENYKYYDHIYSLVQEWTALTSSDSTISGNYYLASDITTTGTITISGEVNLALNGHVIDYTATSQNSVITVSSDATLNLYGDGETIGYGTGVGTAFEFTTDDKSEDSTYTAITGGLITGGYTTSGGGVVVYSGATFNMYGGTIAGNFAEKGAGVKAGGTFNMYDGLIAYNKASNSSIGLGGGVYVDTAGTFIMADGEICYNIAGDTSSNDSAGGGVYVGGTFEMSGDAEIFENAVYGYLNSGSDEELVTDDDDAITISVGLGGGVFTGSKATFTMSENAVISDNYASQYGGGVYATGDTSNGSDYGFYMNGGTISGNESGDGGGGVYLKGDMVMTDGSISANTAVGEGGGVYVNDEDASLVMSGGTIGGDGVGNTAGDGGGGVYVDKGGSFTMSDDAVISYNTADNTESAKEISWENGTDTEANDGNGGGVYISKGTFTMNGGVIEENIATSEVDGDTENGNGGGVYVNYDSATFTMAGGTIQNNTAEYKGGGVYVYNEFEMTGGEISANSAEIGGGVYVNTNADDSVDDFVDTTLTNVNGVFTMSGGSITGNTATTSGGGVALTTAGTFDVSGALVISGNTLTAGTANNVNIASDNVITVAGAIAGTDTVTPYIGVSGMSYGDTVAVAGDGYNGISSDVGYFGLDGESDYIIKFSTTSLVVGYDTPVVVSENNIYAYGDEILITDGGLSENDSNSGVSDDDFVPMVLSKVYFGYIGEDDDYTDPENYQYFYTQADDGSFVVTMAEDGVEATALDLSGCVIYGGGKIDLTSDTRVTMTGGEVGDVFGGNFSGNLTGSTYVTITGGTISASTASLSSGSVYGGSKTDVSISGNTNVTITGGTMVSAFSGGAYGTISGEQSLAIELDSDLTISGVLGTSTVGEGITSFDAGEYQINYFGDAKAIVAYVEDDVLLSATDFVSVGDVKIDSDYSIDDYSYIKVDAVEDDAETGEVDETSNAYFVFAIDLSKVVITVGDTSGSNSTTYDGNTVTSEDVGVKSVVWVVGSLDDDENGEDDDDITLASTDYDITENWVDSNGETTIQNAGSYTKTLTADMDTAGSEFFGTATATYTVKQMSVTVAWSDGSYTYTGSGLTAPTATYTPVGDSASAITLDVSLPENTTFQDAGTYTFTASFDGEDAVSANYTLSGNTKDVTIAKADLTISAVSSTDSFTKTYDGGTSVSQTPALTTDYTIGGIKASDDISVAFSDGAYNASTVVGASSVTFDYEFGGDAIGNYNVPTATTITFDASISALQLTISGTSVADKTYDATTDATATVGTLGNVVEDDEVTVSATAVFDSKNVATAQTTTVEYSIDGDDAGNYIAPVKDTGITAEISQADLSVTGTSVTSRDYNGTNVVAISGGSISVLGSDSVTLGGNETATVASKDYTGETTAVTTAYTISGDDAGNYNLIQPIDLVATISKVQLTVSGTSVDSKTYDATTDIAVTDITVGTLVGVVTGEDAGISVAAVYDSASAGTNKTITVTYSVTNDNYIAPDVDTLENQTISQIIITSGMISAVTDSYTYDGNAKTPTLVVTDSVVGDLVLETDYTVTYSDNTNAGTATATVSAVVGGNFVDDTTVASVTFEIGQLEVDVVWDIENSYTYTGSELDEPTASYVNVGGISVALIVGDLDFTNYGQYTFTASLDGDDADSANYVLKTEADSGSDNASSVTVEIESAENEISDLAIAGWVYGNYSDVDNAPSATATFGTDIAYTYSDDEAGEFTAVVPREIGTYFVKATVEATDDYAGAEQVISFTISRGTVSFAVSDNSVNVADISSFAGVTVSAVNGTGGTVAASDYTISYKDSNGDVVAVENISAVGSYSVWAEITNANYRHLNSTSGTAIQVGVLTVYSTAPKTYTVTFVDNLGGNATSESAGLISGDKVLISALEDITIGTGEDEKDYQFLGWSYNGVTYSAGEYFTVASSDCELVAVWSETFSVGGSVVDQAGDKIAGATVELWLGSKLLGSDTTDSVGAFEIEGVPAGTYNLVVTFEDESRKVITATVLITASADTTVDVVLQGVSYNSYVEVTEGTPDVVVGDLDVAFQDEDGSDSDVIDSFVDDAIASANEGLSQGDDGYVEFDGDNDSVDVSVVLTVDNVGTVEEDHEEIIAEASYDIGLILDISVTQTTVVSDSNGEVKAEASSSVGELSNVVQVVIPLTADTQGYNTYAIYRLHDYGDGNGTVLDTITTKANANGEYIVVNEVDGVATSITLFTKYFSTYALGFADVSSSSGGIVIDKSYTVAGQVTAEDVEVEAEVEADVDVDVDDDVDSDVEVETETPVVPTPGVEVETDSSSFPWWILIVIAIAICGGVGYVVWKKKQQ